MEIKKCPKCGQKGGLMKCPVCHDPVTVKLKTQLKLNEEWRVWKEEKDDNP